MERRRPASDRARWRSESDLRPSPQEASYIATGQCGRLTNPGQYFDDKSIVII